MDVGAIRRAARRHAFQELARKYRTEFKAIYDKEVAKAGVKPKKAAPAKATTAPKARKSAAKKAAA